MLTFFCVFFFFSLVNLSVITGVSAKNSKVEGKLFVLPVIPVCKSVLRAQSDEKLLESFRRQAIKMLVDWKIQYREDVSSPQINPEIQSNFNQSFAVSFF